MPELHYCIVHLINRLVKGITSGIRKKNNEPSETLERSPSLRKSPKGRVMPHGTNASCIYCTDPVM